MDKPTMSKHINKQSYDKARIAWEIQETAQGNAYFGNALLVAKDFEFLTPDDISVLERYLTGRESGSDRFRLQDIVIKIESN